LLENASGADPALDKRRLKGLCFLSPRLSTCRYREQIDQGLGGDPAAAAKAYTILPVAAKILNGWKDWRIHGN
jgi:hypothetical protein